MNKEQIEEFKAMIGKTVKANISNGNSFWDGILSVIEVGKREIVLKSSNSNGSMGNHIVIPFHAAAKLNLKVCE